MKLDVGLDSKDVERVLQLEIRKSIAKAMSADPKAMVTQVVNHALAHKKSSYDRETVFEAAINKMIREEAEGVFKKWLERQRPLIAKAIEARLMKEPKKFGQNVAERLVAGLTKNFYCRVSMDFKDASEE